MRIAALLILFLFVSSSAAWFTKRGRQRRRNKGHGGGYGLGSAEFGRGCGCPTVRPDPCAAYGRSTGVYGSQIGGYGYGVSVGHVRPVYPKPQPPPIVYTNGYKGGQSTLQSFTGGSGKFAGQFKGGFTGTYAVAPVNHGAAIGYKPIPANTFKGVSTSSGFKVSPPLGSSYSTLSSGTTINPSSHLFNTVSSDEQFSGFSSGYGGPTGKITLSNIQSSHEK